MCEGIVDELQGIDLGDKRLNLRSQRVIEALAANPEASVNAACEGWSGTLAAYVQVHDEVGRLKLRATRTIELSQTPKRAARQAHLEIRALTVTSNWKPITV
ncbi:MAG: transposase DNA-binding-containing protein [Planctomycetaceae bacterium]